MRAGALRHKVDLYSPAETVTAFGEIETSNTLVGTFPASVMARTMSEVNDNSTLKSATSYTVTIRYNKTDLTDVSPAAYLMFNGQKLLIKSVAMADFRNRIINISAEVVR